MNGTLVWEAFALPNFFVLESPTPVPFIILLQVALIAF